MMFHDADMRLGQDQKIGKDFYRYDALMSQR